MAWLSADYPIITVVLLWMLEDKLPIVRQEPYCSVNDSHTKICGNLYVSFLCCVSNNNVRIALGKKQTTENQNP